MSFFRQLINRFFQHFSEPVDINLHQITVICAVDRRKWVYQRQRLTCDITALCKPHLSCGSKPPMSNRIIRSRRRPQFLRSACPQLGAADAPLRGQSPMDKFFAATGSVFVGVAFLFSGTIELADASQLQVFVRRQLTLDG